MQPLWTLCGSGVLLLRDWRNVVALVHYDDSPVGAYDEFAVIHLTLRGPRVTEMPVTSQSSKQAGRALWGFPKTVADLEWRQQDGRVTFRRQHEYFRVRAFGISFPLRAKFWTAQRLHGNKVRVPFEIEGRVRLGFRGKQLALLLNDFEMKVFAPLSESRLPTTDH
jgi:hypothetical protein